MVERVHWPALKWPMREPCRLVRQGGFDLCHVWVFGAATAARWRGLSHACGQSMLDSVTGWNVRVNFGKVQPARAGHGDDAAMCFFSYLDE